MAKKELPRNRGAATRCEILISRTGSEWSGQVGGDRNYSWLRTSGQREETSEEYLKHVDLGVIEKILRFRLDF